MNRIRRWMWVFLALVIPVAGLGMLQRQASPPRNSPPRTSPAPSPAPGDVIAQLQQQINSGKVRLTFDANQGYLRSLLSVLKIPISSQGFVFSKSSFQIDLISPERPRAVYFNDDYYVGFVQAGTMIEIIAVDPSKGPVFYTLSQERKARPTFELQTSNCLVCHDSANTAIPRLLVLSILPDVIGNAIGETVFATTDSSPFKERFGGWYVSGTTGDQVHMGNSHAPVRQSVILDKKSYAQQVDLRSGLNVTDLTTRFNTKAYLSPHSDVVALMALVHQTHVHNMITRATYRVRQAIAQKLPADKIKEVVEAQTEPVVEALLFSEAEPLTAPVTGTSDFAAEFARQGPRDSKGRSLRDLDLKTRLLKYPLSYLIYSESFDQMPEINREYVYGRLRSVLGGEDKSAGFSHLSASDRQAILEILQETKPDFAAFLAKP